MSARLFRQTLRWQRVRLIAVIVAAVVWGAFIPVIYEAFRDVFKDLATSGVIPEDLMNFGSGSLFTLPGSITLGIPRVVRGIVPPPLRWQPPPAAPPPGRCAHAALADIAHNNVPPSATNTANCALLMFHLSHVRPWRSRSRAIPIVAWSARREQLFGRAAAAAGGRNGRERAHLR